jgi:ABC-2 type transport system permease protein
MPVFWLSLRQLTGRFCMGLILLLATLPVALAVIVYFTATNDESFDEDFIDILLDGLLVAGILPIVTMALSTAAFGNELEDGTLSDLMLKPLPKWRIALPKLLVSVAISGPLLIASGVAATLAGFSVDFVTALAVGVTLFLGVRLKDFIAASARQPFG